MPVLFRSTLLLLTILLASCGGGDDSQAPAPSSASVPSGMIGAAGGTVTGPAGAQVVIPAGALTQNAAIAVAQSSAGAPALPAGVVSYGQMYAFTPHGTSFSSPATLTVPFDPASVPAGTTPVLYKTNAAQSAWEVVNGATVSGGTMSAQVTSFSFALIGSPPPPPPILPPSPVITNITRGYSLFGVTSVESLEAGFGAIDDVQEGFGVIDDKLDLGPLIFAPPDIRDPEKRTAYAKVFSNEDGHTYWVSAVAPHAGSAVNDETIGSGSVLIQNQYWKKTQQNATLQYTISDIRIEAVTANVIDPRDCEPSELHAIPSWCMADNFAAVMIDMIASRNTEDTYVEGSEFMELGNTVGIDGWQGKWEFGVVDSEFGLPSFLDDDDFVFEQDVDQDGGLHTHVRLKEPIHITILLDEVKVDEKFEVATIVSAIAINEMQGESYYSAFFRDPVTVDGVSVSYVGLEPVAPPDTPLLPFGRPAPQCTTGTQPESGTIEFTRAGFEGVEHIRAPVFVTRTGGTQGAISVLLNTADGSATAGSDYRAVTRVVRFADGEGGTRTAMIPIKSDTLAEGNETVNVTLTDLRGCGILGAQSSAVLTIHDDDAAQVRYTIGGTVSGLIGSGLEFSNSSSSMSAVNGPFTFPVDFADGTAYDLRVAKQPTNPVQICSVAHGSGTINGANVTDIAVSCAAPQPAGGLDPAFGNGGKVAANNPLGAKAIALQPDGRLVILSEQSRLTRFNADGTQDLGFGSSGSVTVTFNNGSDSARGIALQADGKIVVVGRALAGTFDDFGVARYNADGSLDTTFGNNGKLSIDINGSFDDAWVALIQPDGGIVIAGNGGTSTQVGVDSDFAAVRLTSSGTLDGTFGTGGKVHTNIAGRADLVNAAILQSDGKIILAGRVGVDGGALPDTGLVRFNADGTLDTQLGSGAGTGIVRIDLSASGRDSDEAEGVAVDANGKIVVAVVTQNASVYRHTLARLNDTGSLDDSFGTHGIATQSFAAGGDFARALAIQPDGRIVTVGSTRPSTSFSDDFLITRHNADGSLDATFATGGKLIIDFFGSADGVDCVALQPDGKIIAAGLARNGTTNGLAIVRVVP